MGDRLPIQMQPRDWEVLRGLFESRVMTLSHVAALYFDGKKEMAKKRVQKLKAAKLIRERPRHFSDPSILFLTRAAFERLREQGKLSAFPRLEPIDFERRARVSELTLKHELEVMDVKAAMVSAISKTEKFSVAEFSTWPRLYQFEGCRPNGRRVPVKPDGFIRVHGKEDDGSVFEHAFFLEVDRSTETLNILAERCHCYMDFYRSGGFALRNGGTREAFKQFPFRVLIVCKSEERRDNIAARLLRNNPPIGAMVWLSTKTETIASPMGDIWVQPKDLADVLDGHRHCISTANVSDKRYHQFP